MTERVNCIVACERAVEGAHACSAQCMPVKASFQTWHCLQQYASCLHLEHCRSGAARRLPHAALPHLSCCI